MFIHPRQYFGLKKKKNARRKNEIYKKIYAVENTRTRDTSVAHRSY